MHRNACFLLFSMAGFLFSNPVYSQSPEPPPLEAGFGENKIVASGPLFIIGPSPSLPAILFAHDGGTITTAPGGLTLAVGQPTTGLAATGTGSIITAHAITLTGVNSDETPVFPGSMPGSGAVGGASADNGGTISITNSTINARLVGLSAGTDGHISTNKVDIVLGGPHPTGPQIGAAILNANSTLTLTGGSIRDISVGGGGDQSIGLRSENGATLIADGTDISGGFNKSAEATIGGHIVLSNLTITQNFNEAGVQHGALEVSGGSTISTDNVHITSHQDNELGAFAQGGTITLKKQHDQHLRSQRNGDTF